MDPTRRLMLVGGVVGVVGLLVGYTLGRSGVTAAREEGAKKVRRARQAADEADEKRKKLAHELANRPAGPGLRELLHLKATLRLTTAELALRSENIGTARRALKSAQDLLKQLSVGLTGTAEAHLATLGARIGKVHERTLRLDPRDPRAVEQVAQLILEVRRSLVYQSPIVPPTPPTPAKKK